MALSFIEIPAEVRNQVYECLFHGAVIEDCGLSPNPIRTKNYHLSITRTNRQIRAESLSVLQLATTFHFKIGQAGATPVPAHVLREIRTVRLPAHRLKTLDTAPFAQLETLILDVQIEPSVWRVYQNSRYKSSGSSTNIADMVTLGMELGVFEHSWDVHRIWRDESRQFRILCWFSSWVRSDNERQPILVDIDTGMVLQEPRRARGAGNDVYSWTLHESIDPTWSGLKPPQDRNQFKACIGKLRPGSKAILELASMLLDLPPEIRQLIYDYCLGNVHLAQCFMLRPPPGPWRRRLMDNNRFNHYNALAIVSADGKRPSFLGVSRQVRKEVFDLILANSTFRIACHHHDLDTDIILPDWIRSTVELARCVFIDEPCLNTIYAFPKLRMLTCHVYFADHNLRKYGYVSGFGPDTISKLKDMVLTGLEPDNHWTLSDAGYSLVMKVFLDKSRTFRMRIHAGSSWWHGLDLTIKNIETMVNVDDETHVEN